MNASDPQWNSSFVNVYSSPKLAGIPWFSIQGNHDLRQNMTAQVRWSGDPRWRMPDLNYSMTLPLPEAQTLAAAHGFLRQPAASKLVTARAAETTESGARDCVHMGASSATVAAA